MRKLHLLYLVLITAMLPGAYRMIMSEPVGDMAWLFLGSALVLTTLFVFRTQIDHWLFTRSQPPVDVQLERALQVAVVGYPKAMMAAGHSLRDMRIYNHSIEYIDQGMEEPPTDLSHMITAQAHYFKGLDKRWPAHYDRIVLYKHPFLSPDIPDQIHILEAHAEHGTLLLSMEQLLPAFAPRAQFFNPALLVYADAYVQLYAEDLADTFPGDTEDHWEIISKLSEHDRQRLVNYIGYEVDSKSVLLYFAVKRPLDLARVAPQYVDFMRSILPGRFTPAMPSQPLTVQQQGNHT